MAQTTNKIVIGTTIQEFRNSYPRVIPKDAKRDAQWLRPEELCGLNGKWAYTFKDGKLDWALWDVYIDDLTDANFQKCLKATRSLIASYTKVYGKPFEHKELETTFKDPYKERHW